MKKARVSHARPAPRPQVLRRPQLYSRHELEALQPALMNRWEAMTDPETRLQLATLITVCTLLLDDQAALTPAQRAECQRELLLDAAALGVTYGH